MTFEVTPNEFSQALNRVMAAVEKNKENPVIGHVLITTGGGMCTMRATDYFVEITTAVECQGDMAPIVVPADRLHTVMSRYTDRGIARFAREGSGIVITCGRSRQVLPVLEPADNFPTISKGDIGSTFTVEGRVLFDLFETCGFAIATSEVRQPTLEGLHLFAGSVRHFMPGHQPAPPKLCAVATDGYKLMARECLADLPEDMPSVIIPKRAVDKLGRMVKDWAEVHLEINEDRVVASFGPTRFVIKLLEGKYPDWWRLIPKSSPALSYDSDALADSIGNAYAAVRADKRHSALTVTFGEEETTFNIRNEDGRAAGSDACHHSVLETTPPDFAIGYNPDYFLQVIEHFGAETLQFGLTDGSSPTLLTCPNLDDRLAVLMPMRIGVIHGDAQ